MCPTIVPIVEGHGECSAVPILVRRVLHEKLSEYEFVVNHTKRMRRHRIKSDLPRMLRLAARDATGGAILVLIDADEDCAQDLATEISRVSNQQNIDVPVAIVCPNSEYEAWFIASIETLAGEGIGIRGAAIDPSAVCPPDVESISDAKAWLRRYMPRGMTYKETQDQAPFTAKIDIGLAASRSRSFRRLCHAIEELVSGMRSGQASVTPSPTP